MGVLSLLALARKYPSGVIVLYGTSVSSEGALALDLIQIILYSSDRRSSERDVPVINLDYWPGMPVTNNWCFLRRRHSEPDS